MRFVTLPPGVIPWTEPPTTTSWWLPTTVPITSLQSTTANIESIESTSSAQVLIGVVVALSIVIIVGTALFAYCFKRKAAQTNANQNGATSQATNESTHQGPGSSVYMGLDPANVSSGASPYQDLKKPEHTPGSSAYMGLDLANVSSGASHYQDLKKPEHAPGSSVYMGLDQSNVSSGAYQDLKKPEYTYESKIDTVNPSFDNHEYESPDTAITNQAIPDYLDIIE